MGTFFLTSGLLFVILFSFLKKEIVRRNGSELMKTTNRSHLLGITFFQILGVSWLILGILFTTHLVEYPKGIFGIIFDALALLLPVWGFAFYLERRNSK